MKQTILILCAIPVLFSACLSMQTVTFTEDENYIKVYEDVPGTKDELYLKANNWFVKSFGSAESVIQHQDKEQGVILGKYLMHGSARAGLNYSIDSRIYAVIDIRVKDGKARVEIKPQANWQYDPNGMTIYDYSKAQAVTDMSNLCESFHQALQAKTVEF